jgi:hypothetical protein
MSKNKRTTPAARPAKRAPAPSTGERPRRPARRLDADERGRLEAERDAMLRDVFALRSAALRSLADIAARLEADDAAAAPADDAAGD